MKKQMFLVGLITLVALVTLIAYTSVNIAFADNISKAKEFMKAGMYPQAVALLKKEIYGDEKSDGNPLNAEAHFQLGACYVNQLNFNMADDRFASAVQIKPKYGYQISEIYRNAGNFYLNKGKVKKAETLFSKAIDYHPGLREIIANELFSTGQFCLQQGNLVLGEKNFFIASMLDNNLNQQISTLYCDLGNSTEDKNCFYFYDQAKSYSGTHNREIVASLLKRGNRQNEEQRIIYVQKALEFGANRGELLDSCIQFYTKLWNFSDSSILDKNQWFAICQNSKDKWWSQTIVLGKDEKITVGSVTDGDQLRSWSSSGFTIVGINGDTHSYIKNIDMITTFSDAVNGYEEIKIAGNGINTSIVRYKIIRR